MHFAWLSLFLIWPAFAAFEETGAPSRVQCKIATFTAHKDIDSKVDIDYLLDNAKYERVAQTRKTCPKNNEKVVACELPYTWEQLQLRYYFNTQGGGLSIEDSVTGQSSDLEWTTQYKLTGSGYANVSGELTNIKGGLLGMPRMFRIEVSCWATPRDWN